MQPRLFLIGIGAQKAGTTWLARYLRRHPQVLMSRIKEMHFWNCKFPVVEEQPAELRFAVKIAQNMDRREAGAGRPRRLRRRRRLLDERLAMGTDVRAYLDYFEKRSHGRDVWAEITPSYSTLERTAFAAMAGALPNLQLLFVMRNPVDRYWSQLRHAKQQRPHLDLAEAFAAGFSEAGYRLRGDYARTLTEVLAAVPRRHLHTEFFERLFTEKAMRKLCGFLAVYYAEPDFSPRLETEVKAAITDEMRARAYKEFAHVYRFIAEFCGGDMPQNWRDDMRRYS